MDGVSGSEPHFSVRDGWEQSAYTTVTWRVAPDSSPEATFSRSSQAFNGKHSQLLRLGAAAGAADAARIQNYGLDGQGLVLRAGAVYRGYLFARAATSTSADSPADPTKEHQLTLSLRDRTSGATFAQANLTVPAAASAWARLHTWGCHTDAGAPPSPQRTLHGLGCATVGCSTVVCWLIHQAG